MLQDTESNPGWIVEIDIMETVQKNKKFPSVTIDNSEEDWMNCSVEQGKYIGAGDNTKLSEILKTFQKWCEL